jgi:hypothetical protein
MARKRSKPAEVAPSSSYRPSEERMSGPFEDYEVRDALSTLTRAIKIRKNPALMRAVKKEARRQLQAAESTKKAIGD